MAIAQSRAAECSRPERLHVHAVLLGALGPGSVANALTELLDNMPTAAVEKKLWCLGTDPALPHEYDTPAIPRTAFRAFCKLRIPGELQARIASMVVLRSIKAGYIVYMWPPFDLHIIKRAQELGAIVIAERTNCMDSMGREKLSAAFARRGLALPDALFPKDAISKEREQMGQCDFVTAPNAMVAESLRVVGIPEERIIETSYGFNPQRLAQAIGINRPPRPPIFAFVGLGIVRKGLDVLLEAWERSGVEGTLVVAGHIDKEIRRTYASTLSRPDVKVLGYVRDVASVYAAADVFVFPTHEEGGPQVIYEAAGCGLASIVSAMGAGRIVRDGLECLIIDPLDVDDLSAALSKLAQDEPLRRALGIAAAVRSREFTWAKAGSRLYHQLRAIANGRGPIVQTDEARLW